MLTLKDFKNIFGNKVSLKNDIIDVCLGKIRNDKFDLIYRVSVLNIHEVKEFLKLGYILLIKNVSILTLKFYIISIKNHILLKNIVLEQKFKILKSGQDEKQRPTVPLLQPQNI